MNIEDIAGSRQRRVMHGRIRLTPTYFIEVSLYDFDGVYPIEVIWEPVLPSKAQFAGLATLVEHALAPYHEKAMLMGGLFGEDGL